MKENSAAIHVQAPVDVAAFLLNEKRGEILKIESRHRASVVLIPNKHLETPHYKLERIKHDDPRLDDLQASYKMAEEGDTDVGYSKRKEEERKPRQEAVVKSITPDQPAPIVDRREGKSQKNEPATEGFLSWLFSFFRSKPASEAPATAGAKNKDRERSERGGRGRNRAGRGRGRDKDERADSRETKEVREPKVKELKEPKQPKPPREPKEAREPKDGTEPRRERGNRQQRDDKRPLAEEKTLLNNAEAFPSTAHPVTATIDGEQPAQADLLNHPGEESATDASGEPRRRRRRGGRNRNRRDRDQVEGQPTDDSGSEDAHSGSQADHNEFNPVEVVHQFIENTHESHTPHQPEVSVSAAETHAPIAPSSSPEIAKPSTVVAETAAGSHAVEHADTHDHVATHVEQAAVQVTTQPAPAVAAPVVVAPAPVVVVPAPVAVAVAPVAPAASAESLEDALKSAGLTMAVTNPEKLRQVQEASATTAEPPRAPRERKPAPTSASEPLVQIETQR